jgi:hypothetical protein
MVNDGLVNDPPVPKIVLVLIKRILFSRQYCPVFDDPVPRVTPVNDGVKVVHVPIAFNSAAVRILPDVNVPKTAIMFSPLPAESTGV